MINNVLWLLKHRFSCYSNHWSFSI